MNELPPQKEYYPYTAMGYDMKTIYHAFAGYGADVVSSNGVRVSAYSQLQLGMNFLSILRNHYGDWSLNEISSFCFVMNTTIFGNLIGVKDVAHELDMPMSTASHTVLSLEKREALQSYTCIVDKRRKLLRLHPVIVTATVNGSRDIWESQRRLLAEVLVEDQKSKEDLTYT